MNQIRSQNTLSCRVCQIQTAAQVTADREISRQLLQELPSRTPEHAVIESREEHRGLRFAPVYLGTWGFVRIRGSEVK